MEELKLLIEMVSNLPTMAIWVLAGFFAYKTIIIGSVYGVIRLAITKAHDVLVSRKVDYREIRPMLDGICIHGEVSGIMAQLNRIKSKGTHLPDGTGYIHADSTQWLKEAIDDKELKEASGKK